VYYRALIGEDVDKAIAHFEAKLPSASEPPSPYESSLPAQVFINLLVRVGRLDDAIERAGRLLAGLPEAALACPGAAQLCQEAGQPARLLPIAREQGDLVHYAAALIEVESAANTPTRN
jgi:hypothetical protein